MTPEQQHYYWDRLVRAVIRGDSMTEAQKVSLTDEIASKSDGCDDCMELEGACSDFLDGELSEESVVAGYERYKIEGFDVDAYRASLTPPNPSREVDEKLAKIFG